MHNNVLVIDQSECINDQPVQGPFPFAAFSKKALGTRLGCYTPPPYSDVPASHPSQHQNTTPCPIDTLVSTHIQQCSSKGTSSSHGYGCIFSQATSLAATAVSDLADATVTRIVSAVAWAVVAAI